MKYSRPALLMLTGMAEYVGGEGVDKLNFGKRAAAYLYS